MAWLAGYTYRKKITVQTAFLDVNLTDFPLYVPINADANVGGRCMPNGYDIRFTQSDGTTLLSYERVSFSVVAGMATGIFWVKTALVTIPATEIYIYYGLAAQPDVSNPTATFSAYTRVWHLSEAYGTGAGNYKDSCGVGNLTLTDADGDSAQGTGIVGKCVDLNGDADILTDADHPDHDPGGAMTVEVWRNLDVIAINTAYVLHDFGTPRWLIYGGPGVTEKVYFAIRTASGLTQCGPSTTILLTGNWYYVAGVYNKALGTNRLKLYIQGLLEKQANGFNEDVQAGIDGITIGRYGANYINGLQDEIRYSKDAKSTAWIKFVYYNIKEADHELDWTAEEVNVVILVVQDATHGHTADAIALIQYHILAVAEAAHGHLTDNPGPIYIPKTSVDSAFWASIKDHELIHYSSNSQKYVGVKKKVYFAVRPK